MASQHYTPPKHFDPSTHPAENWARWRQRYQYYVDAADIDEKPRNKQIADLLHNIGDTGIEIYNTLDNLPILEKRTVKDILDAISLYYVPYKNTTYIRWLFFNECQSEHQKIDEFVLILRQRSKDCEFEQLTESLIKDRLIGGIRDKSMRERLLKDHNMTLNKAINLCRANEESKKQAKDMEDSSSIDVHAMRQNPGFTPKKKGNYTQDSRNYRQGSGNYKQGSGNHTNNKDNCTRCGTTHQREKCPAYGFACHNCGKQNHYASMCTIKRKQDFRPRVHAVEREENSEDEYAFGINSLSLQIDSVQSEKEQWLEDISVKNTIIRFKLDPGSEVNLLPHSDFLRISKRPELTKSTSKITSYSKNEIIHQGTCKLFCKAKNASGMFNFYVAKDVSPPILGLRACVALGLVKRLHTMNAKSETAESIIKEYSDIFEGMGKLEKEYDIKLKHDAKPVIVPARKIPLSLKSKVKEELERMIKHGIIVKEENPTDWVHPMVLVNKPNGKLRVCLDPRTLNKYIKREHYPIPTSEEIFTELKGAKVFTVLDIASAFWQIPLSEKSSRLCTVSTPFGRYKFLRLPFGINSAPEILQKEMHGLIEGLEGVTSYMDDVLVYGKDHEEHNTRLKLVLSRARALNLTFSKEKLQLATPTITFLGHQITPDGMEVHKSKIEAITAVSQPQNKVELQRFLGMINFLGKYIPNLSEKTHPLRELLRKENEFVWTVDQQQSFENLKALVSQAPVLAFYDPNKTVILSVDASQYGLGAVLLQDSHPIAYASVSLTQAQMKYSQIEKEFLAITWACEHFHFFLYSKEFTVETDHKPILGLISKPIEKLSPRLQRLLVKFMRYNPKLIHVPGKFLYTADTLSRAPNKNKQVNTDYLHGEAAAVHSLVSVSDNKKSEIITSVENDLELQAVKHYIKKGWPRNKPNNAAPTVNAYWHCRHELHEADGFIFRGSRLVIPKQQRKIILAIIHQAHQGITSCQAKAKEAVYWPGMTTDIKQMILACPTCLSYSPANTKEPLIQHEVPELPWDKVGIDFCKALDKAYMLLVDYHSKFIEIRNLKTTTASAVEGELKLIFATHGIPQIMISDNGPPFDSFSLKSFFKEWDVTHITSSPTYPASNGMVERAIGTAKGLILKAVRSGNDPIRAILDYNATPKTGLPSPSEMLMGRKLRTLLPIANKLRKPKFSTSQTVQVLKNKQIQQQESQTRAHPLSPLTTGQSILVQKSHRNWIPAEVIQNESTPRSYKVKTSEGSVLRRNRIHLRPNPNPFPRNELFEHESPEQPIMDQSTTDDFETAVHPNSTLRTPPLMEPLPPERPVMPEVLPVMNQRTTRRGRVIKTPTRFK